MIHELLSSARIEPLSPEPDAVETAWAEVGRRRRARARRAQMVTGLGLVLLVAAALLPSLGQETKMAKLDVAGRDQTREVEAEAPTTDVVEPDDSDSPPSGIGAGTKAAVKPGSSEPQTASPRPGSAPPPRASRPSKPPVDRTRREATLVGCVADWCMSASATRAGDSYALAMDICVPVGTRARRFSYATTQEVDLTVTDGSQEPTSLWTWSVGQTFARNEHHVDVSTGECVTWRTVWDGTDESGNPLEPGSYRLTVRSPAEQAADRTATATFQIS